MYTILGCWKSSSTKIILGRRGSTVEDHVEIAQNAREHTVDSILSSNSAKAVFQLLSIHTASNFRSRCLYTLNKSTLKIRILRVLQYAQEDSLTTIHAIRRYLSASKLHFALLGLLVFLIGCPQHVKIRDLNNNPGRYQHKEVAVTGTVTEGFGFMGQGAFQLDDGTGKIWVLSQNFGVPGKGQKVGIAGNLVGGVSLGTRSFGSAIRLTHTPHY